jgi:hypothetical protein
MKENKSSKITRERQMLLIRTGKYELLYACGSVTFCKQLTSLKNEGYIT